MAEKAKRAVPEGMSTITMHLWFSGNCSKAIEFYKRTFDAQLPGPAVQWPNSDLIMHAMLKIGDSNIMMADAHPSAYEQGPGDRATAGLFCYVENCDLYYDRAVDAGCEVLEEMMDAFWGDRLGKIKDPFGHTWAFATHKWIYSPEEMQQKQQEWMDGSNS